MTWPAYFFAASLALLVAICGIGAWRGSGRPKDASKRRYDRFPAKETAFNYGCPRCGKRLTTGKSNIQSCYLAFCTNSRCKSVVAKPPLGGRDPWTAEAAVYDLHNKMFAENNNKPKY